jgi:hypothetical protein
MTEDEEIAWVNALGFSATLADLRASYTKFTPQPVDPATNVLWGTESDDLRNYYRLYKRTGYPGFLTQAQYWRDFYVNVYSNWQAGGTNVVEPEHVYLMGLIDWWLDHPDQQTLDAIHRIVDFIDQNIHGDPFYETRVTARSLQCLCAYKEKVGQRNVDGKIHELLAGIAGAHVSAGFTTMRYLVGTGVPVDGLPAGQDLRTLFPGNTSAGIVTGANSYDLKGHDGVASFQDMFLVHALCIAARVQSDPALADRAVTIANAWAQHVGRPFWDTTGAFALAIPQDVLTDAPETAMFLYPRKSTPLYITQYAPYCTDAALRTTLLRQALLRQYDELAAIQPSELGGRPRYFPWQTWENGYYLLQK